MNTSTTDKGRDALVEEVRCLGPDTREALDRLGDIEQSTLRHLRDLDAALKAARLALAALTSDREMLNTEVDGDRKEVERRLAAISDAAEQAGYRWLLAPRLRVITELPDDGTA